MAVGAVSGRQRPGSADHVEVEVAPGSGAAVAEAIPVVATAITLEGAARVGRGGEEGEAVAGLEMSWVGDDPWVERTPGVDEEVAAPAALVGPTRDLRLAARAKRWLCVAPVS